MRGELRANEAGRQLNCGTIGLEKSCLSPILILIMQTDRAARADSRYAPEAQPFVPHGEVTCASPIFSEPLCALEFLALRLSPEYRGSTIPDRKSVV